MVQASGVRHCQAFAVTDSERSRQLLEDRLGPAATKGNRALHMAGLQRRHLPVMRNERIVLRNQA